MFDQVVPRYDLLNDLLSLGFDRWWRRRTAAAVAVPRGSIVLDLGCGTGRLFDAYFSRAAPALGSLVGRREAYGYLARSLAQLPPPGEVSAMLDAAGFEAVATRSLAPGMVTLWTARRAGT